MTFKSSIVAFINYFASIQFILFVANDKVNGFAALVCIIIAATCLFVGTLTIVEAQTNKIIKENEMRSFWRWID